MAKYIVHNGIRIASEFEPETFGRLTTIGPRFRLRKISTEKHHTLQVCQCICGQVVIVHVGDVRSSNASCGCYQKAKLSAMSYRHGETGTPEHRSWRKMKSRCLDPNNNRFLYYGGRGIRVCDRWLEPNGQGFINFLADMGRKPSPEHSLDRYPNQDGNYEPGNCRWATDTEQANNKSNNRLLCIDGVEDTLINWCRKYSQDYKRVFARISKGWDEIEALTAPKNARRSK